MAIISKQQYQNESTNWNNCANRRTLPRKRCLAGRRHAYDNSTDCEAQRNASVRRKIRHLETYPVRIAELDKRQKRAGISSRPFVNGQRVDVDLPEFVAADQRSDE